MKAVSSVNLINHKPLSSAVKFKSQSEANKPDYSEAKEDKKFNKIAWYGISIPAAIIAGLSTGFLGPKWSLFAPPQSIGSSVGAESGVRGHSNHSIVRGTLVSEQYKGKTFTALKTQKDGTYILQEGDTLSKSYLKLKANGKIQPGKNVLVSGHIKPATTRDGTPIPGAPNIFYVEDMKSVWF